MYKEGRKALSRLFVYFIGSWIFFVVMAHFFLENVFKHLHLNMLLFDGLLLCLTASLIFFTFSKLDTPSQGKMYKHLFQDHAYPIWIYNVKTLQLIDYNTAFLEKFGYTDKELRNRDILFLRPESEHAKLINVLANIKETQSALASSAVWTYKNKSGELFEMNVSTFVTDLHLEMKNCRAVIGIELNEALKWKQQLRHVAWMQSHVFRRPLANILGLIALLETDNDPVTLSQYLPLIKQSCLELDNKIREIVMTTNAERA